MPLELRAVGALGRGAATYGDAAHTCWKMPDRTGPRDEPDRLPGVPVQVEPGSKLERALGRERGLIGSTVWVHKRDERLHTEHGSSRVEHGQTSGGKRDGDRHDLHAAALSASRSQHSSGSPRNPLSVR